MAGSRRNGALEILDVQEDQPIPEFLDRLHGVAATLLIVRRVELQLHVARIGGVEDPPHFVRALAEIVHVIVKADGDAEIRRPFADLGQQPAQALVVIRDDRPALRTLVGQLQVNPSDVLHEPGVADVLLDLALLGVGIDPRKRSVASIRNPHGVRPDREVDRRRSYTDRPDDFPEARIDAGDRPVVGVGDPD